MDIKIYYDSFYQDDYGNICINEAPVLDDKNIEAYREWLQDLEFSGIKNCPYCNSIIESFSHADEDIVNSFEIYECLRCSFWLSLGTYTDNQCSGMGCHSTIDAQISKLSEYSINLPEICATELSIQIRRNPSLLNSMNPKHLELLVADIFKINFANCETFHVGKPGDGGIDVVFVGSDKEKWLVQVKRRESKLASEGVGTIRNLLGTLMLEDNLKGIVVSTADHFTRMAIVAQQNAAFRGYTIDLIDKGKLDRMLDAALPVRPWLDHLRASFPELESTAIKSIPSRQNKK